jgi:hypothetical protein
MSNENNACLLAPVHKRLEDAHQQWHQAQEQYFSPDSFRLAVQSCIQTLRTVTFVLQNNKRAIPDFDDWYGAWQEKARGDAIMRWAVEARNHIEKRGDLETYSELRAEVIASYTSNLPPIPIKGDLFDDVKELLSHVPSEHVQHQILEHGALRVERRWVANTLPSHELLDALAHVYGRLAQMLVDAHTQMGLTAPQLMEVHGDKMISVPGGGPKDGRLPCMLSRGEKLAAMFSLKDGRTFQMSRETVQLDENQARESLQKYGIAPAIGTEPPTNLRMIARQTFAWTRKVFEVDGYHVPMAFLFKENKPVGQFGLEYENRSDKYLIMRELAVEVERTGADSILHIGEVWMATPAQLPAHGFPSDADDRKEAIALAACSRDETFELTAEIRRSDTAVTLGETVEFDLAKSDMFSPIREVWEKQDKK